ncbi:GerA spore germination protein [Caldalkalibacillus thermarum TA2.A1]|uniref:GerA spore germination protein n=1 Tax=Caldalkalibacillus thermarum (strain TA2.A1) TaxID=986075 RepID=F5L6F5_CALTT|nr:spore germination protein [Caldalkalibacillus thermarum]EGL83065.1 GerA spore germination protein [Caldalkalibacillus thermarum TA2.A1]
MFSRLFKRLNRETVRKRAEYEMTLSADLKQTVTSIENIVGESSDVFKREMRLGKTISATLFFIEGLADKESIEEDVIKPLVHLSPAEAHKLQGSPNLIRSLQEVLTLSSIRVFDSFDQAILHFLGGESLLVIDGVKGLIVLGTKEIKHERSVEEPESEVVVRGPRDGFNETLRTNITLIRRRLRDPNLVIQIGQLGRRSKRDFAIMYIKGITNQDLIDEVRYRVACADVDDMAESGTLEQLIEDDVLSPFPQVQQTERPDKASSALTNGQVVLLLDGTPYVLMLPVTFHLLLKSPEDYYERWQIGSVIRFLRYGAAFMALFLPSLYVAMVSYHQGMIPTPLALSIAGSREGVPFPAFVEALLMEFSIELLREAGIRLPSPIGQTIGIVGGLVIGDAAVRAGLVSPIMVIVVALTAIASFAIPAYNVGITFRLLRFVLMAAAATMGLYGIIIVYILINIHLVGLRSFGSYYLSPFVPYRFLHWLDVVLRAPMPLMRLRPAEPRTLDDKKQD